MIGPTGVGKTEIARRLARLAGAPFIKVEASKFTEVGYVGRDVESMVRDLVDGRVNIGIVLLPLALTLVVINLTGNRTLQGIGILVWLAALLISAVDILMTGFSINRKVKAQFPEESRTRGHVAYGLIRSTVLRRFRMPPPRVSPRKGRTA